MVRLARRKARACFYLFRRECRAILLSMSLGKRHSMENCRFLAKPSVMNVIVMNLRLEVQTDVMICKKLVMKK